MVKKKVFPFELFKDEEHDSKTLAVYKWILTLVSLSDLDQD